MSAVISVTNITPYVGNYQSFQSLLQTPPKEGPRTIPLSFMWSIDAIAPDFAVGVNLRSQSTLQITQICALYVDNLNNDADVSFFFSDTGFRLDVPADSVGLFPVVTNALQFVAYSSQASDGDSTFIQVLNFNPPPVSVEKTQFQSPAVNSQIALPHNATPTFTNIYNGAGTLRGLNITLYGVTASAVDTLEMVLRDANTAAPGAPILYLVFQQVSVAENSYAVATVTGLEVPFGTGLELELIDQGGDITAGSLAITAYVSHK